LFGGGASHTASHSVTLNSGALLVDWCPFVLQAEKGFVVGTIWAMDQLFSV